jgi:dGTPase
VFVEDEKVKLEIAANEIMGTILELFVSAVEDLDNKKDINKVSFKNKKILKLMKVHQPSPNASLYEKYQCVIDYVSGMTGNFAVTLAQQLKGVRSSFQRI